MFNWIKRWFKKEPVIKFRCIEGAYNLGTPIREARKVFPEWLKKQIGIKDVQFARCPGMFDQLQAGYLISAHVDIHIRANKQGIIVNMEVPSPSMQPSPMNYELVDGMVPIRDGVKKLVHKIPLPWAIFCKPGYSTTVVPATMHSPFLDKLYVYPGIVDHDKFPVVNFIFSPLEDCEFTIWAGTPILQLVPFKREVITADYGKANIDDHDRYRFTFFSRLPNLYKKIMHSRKYYLLKEK